MRLSQTLLPELAHEMATTRKLLERVPDEHVGWKPHDKSMSLGRLATHIAEIPGYAQMIVTQELVDFGASSRVPKELTSHQEMVDLFDENVRAAHALIESTENEPLMENWTLRKGEHVIFSLPRIAVLRSMILNHIIHHRGQLSVYLRLQNVPVPSIYGPSADESF